MLFFQEMEEALRCRRALPIEFDGEPESHLIASDALLLPAHPLWW